MKQSKMFIPTLREIPADAEVLSHRLLVKAGYIRQVSAGVYAYLPLAQRVLQKIKKIIREELAQLDAVQMLVPTLLPEEWWDDCPYYFIEQKAIFRVQDQNERDYLLGPTYREAFAFLLNNEINSYKRLPVNLYQFQVKYRDALRPRHGLINCREIMMQEGYSFHLNQTSLVEKSQQTEQAYQRVLDRCGLTVQNVQTLTNEATGEVLQEFVALSEIGDKEIAYGAQGSAGMLRELAPTMAVEKQLKDALFPLEAYAFKGPLRAAGKARALSQKRQIQTIPVRIDAEIGVLLLRGDHTLSLAKARQYFAPAIVSLMEESEIETVFGVPAEYVGPLHLPEGFNIYADWSILALENALAGGNEMGTFYQNVNESRDFVPFAYTDLRLVETGDPMPNTATDTYLCDTGVTVAQVRRLGTDYSHKHSLQVLDEEGQQKSMLLGYYGLNLNSLLAMLVEQHSQAQGISWPSAVAPYDIHLLQVAMDDDAQSTLTEEIFEKLTAMDYEVLIDDRDERAGVKFMDADLIGCPVRITIGKKAIEGVVELKIIETQAMVEVLKDDLIATLEILLQTNG